MKFAAKSDSSLLWENDNIKGHSKECNKIKSKLIRLSQSKISNSSALKIIS